MRGHHELGQRLNAAIADECADAAFYAPVLQISKTYDGVETFAEARRDKLDHARELTQLVY